MVYEGINIRLARPEDAESILQLILRLKRLNEEFDPLLKVRDDAAEVGRKYVEEAIKTANSLVVVADRDGKIIGVVKADIRTRLFYEPKTEGHIVDLYVLPEFRRKGLGEKLIQHMVDALKGKVELITAEFPTLNQIAVNFYTKLGFRGVISTYARES